MSTASTSIGTRFRPATNEASDSQTNSLDAIACVADLIRIALVVGMLAVAVQLALAGNALTLGEISYGGCVSSDGSSGLCAVTNGLSLSGAGSAVISPESGSSGARGQRSAAGAGA